MGRNIIDAAVFWKVIGAYNNQTIITQTILALLLVAGLILSYTGKIKWAAKLILGIAHLYIGVVFFGIFGTEPIQTFFALPLYLGCGGLLLFECIHNRDDVLNRPQKWQAVLLSLFALYPVISCLFGSTFPEMVTYIMPCPIVSVSIAVYSGYRRKNRLLLLFLSIWGLTGVKSLIFSAYEDIILLVAGICCVCVLFKACKAKTKTIGTPS